MEKEAYIEIFLKSHPNFFEREVKDISEDLVYEEMFLELKDFSGGRVTPPKGVEFGSYTGSLDEFREKVQTVDKGWPEFFDDSSEIFCAFLNGEPVSFCLIEDMGTLNHDGKIIRIGGPGCVGTLPGYRNRGIGLSMVDRVTAILKERGYDYSYIHYTGVASWYAKLGYKTEICWNKNGILDV